MLAFMRCGSPEKKENGQRGKKSLRRKIVEWVAGIVIGLVLMWSPFYYSFFAAQGRIDEVCAAIPTGGLSPEEIQSTAAASQLKFVIPNPSSGQKAFIYADVPTIRAVRFVKVENGKIMGCARGKRNDG